MDEDRRIRFLVAPLLFLSSLLWGLARNPKASIVNMLPGLKLDQLDSTNVLSILTLIAGGGIVVFSLGFIIGTTSYVLLRLTFIAVSWHRGGSSCHEVYLDKESLNIIWTMLGVPGQADRKDEFLAGVTFDHDVLMQQHEGIHRWLMRRWNAFSVAITSAIGLLLSIVVGRLLDLTLVREWWLPVLLVSLTFVFSAVMAWCDTMAMIRFQARRPQRIPETRDL